MKNAQRIPILFFTLLTLSFAYVACSDLIEEDFSDKEVKIVAPQDSTTTVHQTIVFAWEKITHAQGYNLQIATPNFERAQTLVLDTLIMAPDSVRVNTSFSRKLLPGNFQWRINAFNSSSSTPYAYATFTIADNTTVTESIPEN